MELHYLCHGTDYLSSFWLLSPPERNISSLVAKCSIIFTDQSVGVFHMVQRGGWKQHCVNIELFSDDICGLVKMPIWWFLFIYSSPHHKWNKQSTHGGGCLLSCYNLQTKVCIKQIQMEISNFYESEYFFMGSINFWGVDLKGVLLKGSHMTMYDRESSRIFDNNLYPLSK